MKWIQNLPSHNFQVINAGGLTWLTGGVVLRMMWYQKPIDEWILGMWLTFLGALWGISYTYFRKKRETFDPNAVPTKEKVDAKDAAQRAGVATGSVGVESHEDRTLVQHEEVSPERQESPEEPSPEVRRAIFRE